MLAVKTIKSNSRHSQAGIAVDQPARCEKEQKAWIRSQTLKSDAFEQDEGRGERIDRNRPGEID